MTTRGDLWRFDAVELAAAIRTRRISSREAVGSHLDRLASVNPYINAVVDPLADAPGTGGSGSADAPK